MTFSTQTNSSQAVYQYRLVSQLRDSVLDRTDVLDRVKALSLLPDGMHVTTAMVAAYFEVGLEAIKSLVKDHRAELAANG
ncbi:hypothetical protein ABT063_26095 [Streptomyces sp. NPDC002838]|uniref:hypothetical protein n=1 Tax=Streptomyces sp. NPDC002838 TaxID=3154436 RepID=UPI0033177581